MIVQAMDNVQIISLFGYDSNMTEALDLSHMRNLHILVLDEHVQIKALPPNLKLLRCLGVKSKPQLKAKQIIGGLPEENHLKVFDLLETHIYSFPSKNISNKVQEFNYTSRLNLC